jgi:hypothetical protein
MLEVRGWDCDEEAEDDSEGDGPPPCKTCEEEVEAGMRDEEGEISGKYVEGPGGR